MQSCKGSAVNKGKQAKGKKRKKKTKTKTIKQRKKYTKIKIMARTLTPKEKNWKRFQICWFSLHIHSRLYFQSLIDFSFPPFPLVYNVISAIILALTEVTPWSNDASAMRATLKKWICVLSVFIAIIPTHALTLSNVDEPSRSWIPREHIQVQKEK